MRIIEWFLSLFLKPKPAPAPKPPVPKPTPKPTPQPKPPQYQFPDYARELLKLHNEARSKPLELNRKLQQAAEKHARWMAENRRMSHTGQGRSSHGDRIRAEGYRGTYTAENVAWNQKTPGRVFTAWINSRGHRRNIKNTNLTECGFGMVNVGGGPYWCAVFARPASINSDDKYNYNFYYYPSDE